METDLVVRAQHGDEDAFGTLVTAMFARLYRLADNILSDIDLAEDATQHAVIQMWRNLPRLRDPERFEAWSRRILVNACFTESKKAKRWRPGLSSVVETDHAAAQELSGVVYRDQLERGFRRLSIEQRAVLVLHHYQGLNLPEIAETLGIPVGTAHSRLYKGRLAMRAALEADERMPQSDASVKGAIR